MYLKLNYVYVIFSTRGKIKIFILLGLNNGFKVGQFSFVRTSHKIHTYGYASLRNPISFFLLNDHEFNFVELYI